MKTINRCHNCGSLMRLYALDYGGRPVYLCTRSLGHADRQDRLELLPCNSLYLVIAGRLTPVPAVLVGGQPARSPLVSSFDPDFRPRPRAPQEAVHEGPCGLGAEGIEAVPWPEHEAAGVPT